MRRRDLETLKKPYPNPKRHPDDRFADALGLALADTRALEDAFYNDLDPSIFGIGWWKAYEPSFGTRARIYISDHLFRSAASIETNLIEARLHLLEALDAFEQEDARIADMVQLGPGNQPIPKHPRSEKALDDLPQHLRTLHISGFFRALASAFDCLGACMHGVLALNGWILGASFGVARGSLKNLSTKPDKDVERKAVKATIDALINASGPTGWLEWTLDYRHMLVHRARRFELSTLEIESKLVDQQGRPIIRTREIPQLARAPGRSDVEVWRDVQIPPVLTESAITTMEEILKSSQATISGIMRELLRFWTWRKNNVATLTQPADQWPNGAVGNASGFAGYEPTQVRYSPTMMTASPIALHRLQVASLANGAERNWPSFGGTGDNQ